MAYINRLSDINANIVALNDKQTINNNSLNTVNSNVESIKNTLDVKMDSLINGIDKLNATSNTSLSLTAFTQSGYRESGTGYILTNEGDDYSEINSHFFAEDYVYLISSTDDNTSTNGLTKIQIIGINNKYDEISEELILNGTTEVISVNKYICVNKMVPISGIIATSSNVSVYKKYTESSIDYNITFCFMSPISSYNPFIVVPRNKTYKLKKFLVTSSDNTNISILKYNLKTNTLIPIFNTSNQTLINIDFDSLGLTELITGESILINQSINVASNYNIIWNIY
jgi:hypothetical protein